MLETLEPFLMPPYCHVVDMVMAGDMDMDMDMDKDMDMDMDMDMDTMMMK
jgi:hypothetical protein